MSNENNNYNLNTKWVLWCHSLTNKNWDKDSYNKIYEIKNLYDYNSFIEIIEKQNYFDSMFFLMRDNIYPIWEDENNVDGCSLTIKIPSSDVKKEWDNLVLKCISESIHKKLENYNNITGLSITPKKEFNIVKIWFRENIKNLDIIDKQINLYEPYLKFNNIKLKKHKY
tara:strand:+ start:341 stop:847 length:507 start_codon:yes stop_codon:yes gene_type:complete